MTLPPPIYDLVLLLDAQAEESTRAKILADARASIEARGEIVRDDDWGERPLSYPIDHKKSADYHLIQFHVSDKDLLSGLDRTLRITDGVMRFRLIKLRPGTPDPPDMRSSAAPPAGRRGGPGRAAPRRGRGPRRRGPGSGPRGSSGGTPPPPLAPASAEQPAGEAPAGEAEAPAAAAPEADPGDGADGDAAPAGDAS